jgi:hypothetical protein
VGLPPADEQCADEEEAMDVVLRVTRGPLSRGLRCVVRRYFL